MRHLVINCATGAARDSESGVRACWLWQGEGGRSEGATQARVDMPFLFKAFESGQAPPPRPGTKKAEETRAATIHEYLDWTLTRQEGLVDDEKVTEKAVGASPPGCILGSRSAIGLRSQRGWRGMAGFSRLACQMEIVEGMDAWEGLRDGSHVGLVRLRAKGMDPWGTLWDLVGGAEP